LAGFLSNLRRAIAEPRIRKGLEENMRRMKVRLESDYEDLMKTLPNTSYTELAKNRSADLRVITPEAQSKRSSSNDDKH
jgi:hypothetical protein